MSHGPEHQIEQAEHAAHASHDGFNKNVTMSIAMVAAVLACVSMLGHRSHNETLRLQGEALSLQAEASIKSTQAANKWAYYQSKTVHELEAKIAVEFLGIVAVRPEKKKELDEVNKRHESSIAKYADKLPKEMAKAEELVKKAEDLMEKAEEKIKLSHKEHLIAARLDLGELGLQFAVVLCSLAILTRSRGFWFGGIAGAVIGAAISATGLLGLFLGEQH